MSDKSQNKPALYIHVKVADGQETRIGSRIGVAFHHKDGVGLNILLDAQPIPLDGGKIELIGLPVKESTKP
ncbi:hypothetical protein [Lewinella sp. LCG006]|uniref:hypothetical protein n=1 Tax=Lewinella sp. LCG006 TaxID=3231911 RepID=UPI00346149CB